MRMQSRTLALALAAVASGACTDSAGGGSGGGDGGGGGGAGGGAGLDGGGGTAVLEAYLKAAVTDEFDVFGVSAAISDDGNTLVLGAFGEDGNATAVDGDAEDDSANNAGAAYVFARNGSTWEEQAYLKASN